MDTMLRSRIIVKKKPAIRGNLLIDPVRVYTDGKVFRRKTEKPGINAALALVLDCSYSMHIQGWAPKMLAFCSCLAEGAREAGASVGCWLFGQGYYPVSTKELSLIAPPDLGGTYISPPYEEAVDWLESHDSSNYLRKVCIILTDGRPDGSDLKQIKEVNLGAHAAGIVTLLGHEANFTVKEFKEKWMPNCEAFEIGGNFALAAHFLASKVARSPLVRPLD